MRRRNARGLTVVFAVMVMFAGSVLTSSARAATGGTGTDGVPSPVVTLNPPVVVGTAPRTINVSDGPLNDYEVSNGTAAVVGSATYGTLQPVYASEGPPDLEGAFPASGLQCGANQVQVAYFSYDYNTIRRDFGNLVALCPTITLNPNAGYLAGKPTTVTVTPTDFDGYQNDRPKVLTFDGRPLGTFGYKKPISFVATAGCGAHQVTLIQASAYGTLSASAVYTVRCPSAAVNPPVISRASQPIPVSVTANAFPPNAAVTIAINGSPARGATTDGAGNLAAPVTVMNLACAAYTVTVTTNGTFGGARVSASAPLTVTCSAVITVDPGVISAGMTSHVTGVGFTSGSSVTLVWQLMDGTTLPVNGSPQIALSPSGAIDFYTLVMNTDIIGARTLIGTDTKGLAASAPVVVARGTMQPSNSGQSVQRLVTRR